MRDVVRGIAVLGARALRVRPWWRSPPSSSWGASPRRCAASSGGEPRRTHLRHAALPLAW